jgi:hypothetical protein
MPFGPVRTMPKVGELSEPTIAAVVVVPPPFEAPPPPEVAPPALDVHAATARTAMARKERTRLMDICDSEIYERTVLGSHTRSTWADGAAVSSRSWEATDEIAIRARRMATTAKPLRDLLVGDRGG